MTFKKASLNRILQIDFVRNVNLTGKILEFGTNLNSSKRFSLFSKIQEPNELFFADKSFSENLIDKHHSYEDLEKKLSYNDSKFNNVLVFNVLEHVYDFNNSINEIFRILNIGGKIVGAVPFFYRIHNAPNDYFRITSQALEKKLTETGFKNVTVKELGFGPFTACYALLFDYFKYIPLFNNLFLIITIGCDKFLQIFVKSRLGNQYPISICFIGEKN